MTHSVSDPTPTSLPCITTCEPAGLANRPKPRPKAVACAPSRWLLWSFFFFATFASRHDAPARINRPDPEIQQALTGTWRADLTAQRFFPLKTAFTTYHDNGRFKFVAIGQISGLDARVEVQGTWRIENGDLIERTTEAPEPSLIGESQRSTILSLSPTRMRMRGNSGLVQQLQRSDLPANLPPTSRWMVAMMASVDRRKYAVKTPQPSYPYQAMKNGAEGRGIFRLIVSAGGDVRTVQVLQGTGHKVLDQAAVAGLQGWRFMPGKVKEFVIPVIFTRRGN